MKRLNHCPFDVIVVRERRGLQRRGEVCGGAESDTAFGFMLMIDLLAAFVGPGWTVDRRARNDARLVRAGGVIDQGVIRRFSGLPGARDPSLTTSKSFAVSPRNAGFSTPLSQRVS